MFKNIKHNNVRSLKFRLRNDKYYDFMLYRGEGVSIGGNNCVVADIRPYNMSDGKVISETEWVDAKNDGVILTNIGYTGIDNGLITFRKDVISNAEFLNIYTGSTYDVDGSKSFYMTPVSGNSNQYKYFYELNEDKSGGYISLKGGFLQGFFKLYGNEYQTLPSFIEDEWNFEFVLRRRDFDVHYRTINHTHPENNGMFFYIGTRAENKFALEYNDGKGGYASHNSSEYFNDEYNQLNNVTECNYFESDEKLPITDECGAGYTNNNEYYEKEISLKDVVLTTDDGHDVSKKGYYEIKTDNKFLTFDHTEDGFTTKTFDPENPYVIFEGRNDWDNPNYFVLMNHTCTGQTTKTIEKYLESNTKEYDLYDDIRDNAFGLKINSDGSIEYRYGITDCETDSKYKVETEVSKPNLIPMDEWVTINVRFFILNSNNAECGTKIGKRKMKMYIYVNGNLVLVSKELPEFRFRELNDEKERQETVPFNISLGGGTQGLADGIWLNYYDKPDYVFPLEQDFCGSFLGDIKSFKFYNCFMDYEAINDNVFKG